MRVLVLDDSQARHQHFAEGLDGAQVDHVTTSDDAYKLLRHNQYDAVFLDHDLEMAGPLCGSGTELVTAIAMLMSVGHYRNQTAIHCVHSANYERARWMFGALQEANVVVTRCASAWTEQQALTTFAAVGEWTLPVRWTDPLTF